jgi:hypothetical protein
MKLSIIVTALGLLAFPAIARAHGGNSDANVVHACIGNISKVVRIVGATGSCLSSPSLAAETPAHWDIQGAPGINGIDGTSVTFVNYFAGNQNGCPNGGAIYAAGNPAVNAYVCNGANGADGTGAVRADGPCFDNTNRYVNCGNGTVTDTITGLIWLRYAGCLGSHDWSMANQLAASLKDGDCGGTLTDKSSPGDWRLPTKDEWNATIAAAIDLGCSVIHVTNDPGTGCYISGPTSFQGLAFFNYWSSTGNGTLPDRAWEVNLNTGAVNSTFFKASTTGVWAVRSGAR